MKSYVNSETFEMLNDITLKRRNSLYLNSPYYHLHGNVEIKPYLMTLNIKLAQLGYTINGAACNALYDLKTQNESHVKQDMIACYNAVKKYVGDDVKYVPMYTGFPEEVINMSDAELIVNAILHYWSAGTFFVNEEERQKFLVDYNDDDSLDFEAIEKMSSCKKLDVINDTTELKTIFDNLISSKTSLSEDDKKDLDIYFKHFYIASVDDVPEIGYKENMAFVMSEIFKYHKTNINPNCFKNSLKTATDVLRLHAALSDGDVSLAKPCRFVNLPNGIYKFMLEILDRIPSKQLLEDFFRYPEQWKRIGEKLHPGKYKMKYQNVANAFKLLRSGEKPLTFMGRVNKHIFEGNIESAAKLLATRPGELARSLDRLLRNSNKEQQAQIITLFLHISKELPIPMLLQIQSHFASRNNAERVFMPKGGTSKSFVKQNDLKPIDSSVESTIENMCKNAIILKLMDKDYMGNVYIDSSFDGFIVPYNQRSASASTRPVVRGSKWNLDETSKYIRGFCWWTNTEEGDRIDVDLSVMFTSSLGGPNETDIRCASVSYSDLRLVIKNQFLAYHSGDIINGGPADGVGAAEFVDIDIDACVSHGYRYAIFTVHSFTSAYFSTYNSRAGFMEIDESDCGLNKACDTIFDPSKVKMKFDLNSDANSCVAFAIDLVDRKVIWLDTTNACKGVINIKSNYNTTMTATRALINGSRTTLTELVRMNAMARGRLVETADEADIIFAIDKDMYPDKNVVTPWEFDRFMSEYM